MKQSVLIVFLGVGLVFGAITGLGADADEKELGLGLSQGKFALRIVRAADAEGLFDGTVTAKQSSEKLAGLGLAFENGWQVNEELTRGDLVFAYNRLTKMGERVSSKPSEASGESAKDDAVKPEDMTVTQLIDAIVEAVKDALASITTERQPVSPSRPLF